LDAAHHLAYMRETRIVIRSLVLPRDASCDQITLFQGMRDCLGTTVRRFQALQTGALGGPFDVEGMWPHPHNDAIGRLDIRFLDDGGQVRVLPRGVRIVNGMECLVVVRRDARKK
jgi:hypothetical protein